jgi:hypothetical protein
MSTAALGISDHRDLYHLETARQRFTQLGIDAHQANRLALYVALRLHETFDPTLQRMTPTYTKEQAWQQVDAICGPRQETSDV